MGKLESVRSGGFPRRQDLMKMTAEELQITRVMMAVEMFGCFEALTEAVELMRKARDRVADHVEGKV